ncbi:MAG: glucose-6-phosphate isomerase [Anaerovoracaceae bacterium]|jgi:glucose-6-phosphate isomerase
MQKKELSLNISDSLVTEDRIMDYQSRLNENQSRLESGKDEFTGWVKLPFEYDQEEINRIIKTAAKIQNQCDAFVVIGIGGSYLGARAAIEMLKSSNKCIPDIYFAGQNISGTYHKELLEQIKDKDICLCVISKSGTTTETSIAFALLKECLIQKYGEEEAKQRIYAITDRKKGVLREEVKKEGYISFVVPDDIGGRYSVLTAVGLLPIAVAGIDIEAMLKGAAAEARNKTNGFLYAAIRNELFKRGKVIEIFEYYEPKLQYFGEWLKQLFGESEGKEGKGIFPATLQFSTDLHSMGQFLQEGNQIFFETVLNIIEPQKDLVVPEKVGGILAGKSMNQVNQAALKGVMAAHRSAGVPMIRIDIPSLTPYDFGQMVYFFERSCALSAYITGVNPFNQPGVENYKAEMRKML